MSRPRNNYLLALIAGSVLIIVIGSWFLLSGEQDITNVPPKGQHVVAIGNSLVAGVGDNGGEGFVGDLEERLGITIRNEGVAGNTSADVLARLKEDVLQDEADIVILLVGGNDYLKRVEERETRQHIAASIEKLHDSGAVVILLGVRGGILGDGYAGMYESLAQHYRTYHVADVLDGLLGNPELMADRIHPNDQGYEFIADRVEPVLRELLSAAQTP